MIIEPDPLEPTKRTNALEFIRIRRVEFINGKRAKVNAHATHDLVGRSRILRRSRQALLVLACLARAPNALRSVMLDPRPRRAMGARLDGVSCFRRVDRGTVE